MKIIGLNKTGTFVFENATGTTLGIKDSACTFCTHTGPCLLQAGTPLCICLLCLDAMFATNRTERKARHE